MTFFQFYSDVFCMNIFTKDKPFNIQPHDYVNRTDFLIVDNISPLK